jgi:hypothetical protein
MGEKVSGVGGSLDVVALDESRLAVSKISHPLDL